MATRIINIKLPGKKRVPSKRRAADTVVPSVKGIRSMTPSVISLTKRASVIADGLRVIKAARDVAAKTGNAELAALVNSPRLNKAIDAAVKRFGRDADSILRTMLATSNDDPLEAAQAFGSGSVNTPHNSGDPLVAAGLDAWEGGGMDAAKIQQIRNARFSVAQDQAEALGAVNPARIAAGLPDDVDFDPVATMEAKK
jgi:hypothetical protein